MRERARTWLETSLVACRLPRLLSAMHRGEVLVLAYHNVVPDELLETGDPSLHLKLSSFRQHIELLTALGTVVSIEQALDSRGRSARSPRIVLTFDDAYAGAVRLALPELARAGLPATIFVAPGMLGGRSFWWDAVRGPTGIGPSVDFREHVLSDFEGRDEMARSRAPDFGHRLRRPPPDALTCTEAELVRAIGEFPSITLGAHTWDHLCLASAGEEVAESQLARCLDWLRPFGARGLPLLAYPYGRASARVDRVAARLGFQGTFLVEGGAFDPRIAGRFSMPRLNVPAGVSQNGFALRMTGIYR